jgi:hypothetical protein
LLAAQRLTEGDFVTAVALGAVSTLMGLGAQQKTTGLAEQIVDHAEETLRRNAG